MAHYRFELQVLSSSWDGHNRHGPKTGDCAPLGEGNPEANTIWPGMRPSSLPSGILTYPAVWPQQTWAKIGDSIGRTILQMLDQKWYCPQNAFSTLILLVGRQEEHLVRKKIARWAAGVVVCLEQSSNDLHMVQLIPVPISCFIRIQIGLPFLVLAYPGCPGKEAIKRVSVWLKSSTNLRQL